MTLKVVWLYSRDMNIYGDYGNILALKKQAQLRAIDLDIVEYNQGDEFPLDADIVIGGGGQDSGQSKIQEDLLRIAPILRDLANKGVPMLMICGLFQLFGDYFETIDGQKIKGVCIFKGVKTIGGDERLIGNIVERSEDFGDIVGYENHSGQTHLSKNVRPLGMVKSGAGNNLVGDFEGARYKNVIGTYLHGSVLPKNPELTLFLLKIALENGGHDLPQVEFDNIEEADKIARMTKRARAVAVELGR